jgi:hypothetical protein
MTPEVGTGHTHMHFCVFSLLFCERDNDYVCDERGDLALDLLDPKSETDRGAVID